jgi:endonuclease YncB( thermonuclease family)
VQALADHVQRVFGGVEEDTAGLGGREASQAGGAGRDGEREVKGQGIDCPERDQAPWGPQATARVSALVLGASVQIEVALQSRDRYGRLLGSIWRHGQLIQEQLVREGLCVPYVVPPNITYVDRIRAASEHARRDGVGIYAPAGPLLESPREYRRRRSGTDQP